MISSLLRLKARAAEVTYVQAQPIYCFAVWMWSSMTFSCQNRMILPRRKPLSHKMLEVGIFALILGLDQVIWRSTYKEATERNVSHRYAVGGWVITLCKSCSIAKVEHL